MKNSVILLAGGYSSRMGHPLPKQYIEVNGKTIFEICLEKFLNHSKVDNIVIVINKNHYSFISKIIDKISLSKLVEITEGGELRALSAYNGLKFLQKYSPKHVLIHDIARPFFTSHLLDNIFECLESHSCVVPVLKPTDSIKVISGSTIIKTIDREEIHFVQTPQGFDYKTILKLHQENQNVNITDDSILYENALLPIFTINGERNNQKITYMDDLKNFNTQNYIIKTGHGFDVHAFKPPVFSENNYIMLGGIKVPHQYSLEAHSDGDVVLHSLCDALLGALGKGDIGEHFPPTDKKWKDASSMIFVSHIMSLLKNMQSKVINVDITILAESPKIIKYKVQMKQIIALNLEIPEDFVNIKATTTEKLGFIGRQEGLASLCNVLIESPKK